MPATMLRALIALAILLGAPAAFAQSRAVPPPPAQAPPANQIDLNNASRDDLMTLDGIGEVRADAIIRARPFKAKTELVERRLIPEALYEKIADKVMARPPPAAPPPARTPAPPQQRRS
jgi:competence protein ComEA